MSKGVSYVVGIQNPDHIRKHLLESAKQSISVLKQKKKLSEIRAKRVQKISALREEISSMSKSLTALKKNLPARSNAPKIAKKKTKSATTKKKKEPAPAAHPPSDLAELKGIGPARVTKLQDIGIHSIMDLSQASASALGKADIVEGTATKLIDRAKEHLGVDSQEEVQPKVKTEMELLEDKLSAIESKLNNL